MWRTVFNTFGDGLALAAGWCALFFVIRVRRTYFLDSRFFIGIANIAFNIILAQNLISDLTFVPPSQLVFISMIVVTAISIGFASYLLERNPEGSGFLELKRFLLKPAKPFLAYVAVVLGWATLGILFQPWSLKQTMTGDSAFYYSYQLWFLLLSSIFLAAFLVMPVTSIYRQGRSLSDSKATRSLKIISFSWSGFGAVSVFQLALPTIQTIGAVTEGLLFVMIAFALREPTVLGRIIPSAPTGQRSVYSLPGTDTIVLYRTDSDRRKLVESFAREEWRSRRRAACLVARSETPFYMAILKGMGVNVTLGGTPSVSVQPINDVLQRPSGGISPTPRNGENQLIDLGDLDVTQVRMFIESARETDAKGGFGKKSRTWAVNAEEAHPMILSLIRDLNPRNKTVDRAGRLDSFSALLGVEHRDICGSKLLLEFDPSSLFEDLVEKFVEEFQANVQSVAIFTSIGSPVNRRLGKQPELNLFSFSSKTSTPSRGLGEEVLLPERDSSLLLDAVDKLLQTNSGQHMALAFDVFTDLVLLQGFEKAYGVLSSILEMAESGSATTLVLLNYTAHDERVLSGVRGLFVSHILCDSNGVRLVRFQEPKSCSRLEDERSAFDETVKRGVGGS